MINLIKSKSKFWQINQTIHGIREKLQIKSFLSLGDVIVLALTEYFVASLEASNILIKIK